MSEELRKKAEKRVEAKMGFFITGITFACTAVILIMLSLYLPQIAVWLLLPVPVMGMVLGILYVSIFGFPTSGNPSTAWREEAIKKEMKRLHQEKKAADPHEEELSEADRLELEELERLKEKWEWKEGDLVD